MANLVRSAKSGNDWTPIDLDAYNIKVIFQDTAAFFGTTDLPLPDIDNEALTLTDVNSTQNDDSYAFLRIMDLAMTARSGQESAVADFVVTLFRMLRYTGRSAGRVGRTRYDLAFSACGQERNARTDVCVINDSQDVLLLVQEDKIYLGHTDPEAQLIATAIAAFSSNNKVRVSLFGLDPIPSKLIPGITFTGTMPIFYKIPITADLARAIQFGEYPAQETVVFAHVPRVPRPSQRYNEGMKPLDNRRVVLSCFEAFKRFL